MDRLNLNTAANSDVCFDDANPTPIVAGWRQRIGAGYLFLHVGPMGFSLVLPLLGAASVRTPPSLMGMLAVMPVALAFHVFAFLLNDFFDLDLDRTEPLRAEDPLVRGTVSRHFVLWLALFQIPLAFGLTALLVDDPRAYAALGTAFACVAVYNLWGKRFPVPPITDGIQGLGWSAIVLYGALATGDLTFGTTTAMTLVLLYVLMSNGVHGTLRDLPNDYRCGVRTTATFFGARPLPGGTAFVGYGMLIYAAGLQLLTLFSVTLAVREMGKASVRSHDPIILVVVLLGVLSTALLVWAVASFRTRRVMMFAGLLHLIVTLALSVAPFAMRLSGPGRVLVLCVLVLPIVALIVKNGLWWE